MNYWQNVLVVVGKSREIEKLVYGLAKYMGVIGLS